VWKTAYKFQTFDNRLIKFLSRAWVPTADTLLAVANQQTRTLVGEQ